MYKGIKVIIDQSSALCLGIILLLPMGIIAILVKVTSKGPILFKQERYGVYSKKFVIYKFRTMYVEAPEVSNQEFKNRNDFLTPIGRILRHLSLDELPQIFNVIKGDMSFIGPRPLAESDVNVIKMREKNGASQVRPGITGLAQVNGRNNITDEDKAAFDGTYAEGLSLNTDLKILFRTICNVLLEKDIDKDSIDLKNKGERKL
ncbi:Lipid carrier : UDP-N-acetylgalactosaminyltransferase [Weissella jogaejeotgali]|uniref:Lipid carrier: UDP-N-acetylgalactosaminyltransferase n=1 Tax=Weissella jogaejeotgali TaxID=1631871 RepID=A0A1L6RB63_9LACO|nr:sugar transferase [Weissella jogaejeotgali]APS41763.1 Lipid carrier : UDP-N-acetylgalactosaminyltransferase [Weissella jogaejeotgali]